MKKLKLSIIVSVVAILAMVFVSCAPKELSAIDAYKEAQKKMMEAKSYTLDADIKYEAAAKEGVEISSEAQNLVDMMKNMKYNLSAKVDQENQKMSIKGDINVTGISFAFDTFLSKDRVNLRVPMVASRIDFTKEELVDVLKKLEEKMPGTFPVIAEGKTFVDALDIDYITGDFLNKVSSIYGKIMTKSIELQPVDGIKDLGKMDFELKSGKTSLRGIELSFDADKIVTMYKDLINSIIEDKDLMTEIKTLAKEVSKKYGNYDLTDEVIDEALNQVKVALNESNMEDNEDYKKAIEAFKSYLSDTKMILGLDKDNHILVIKSDMQVDYSNVLPELATEELNGVVLNMSLNYEISDYNKTKVEPIEEDDKINLKELIKTYMGIEL